MSEVDVHLDGVTASSGLVFEQVVGSLASTTMSFGDSEKVPHVDIDIVDDSVRPGRHPLRRAAAPKQLERREIRGGI